ncbi:DUF5681 domain-containing protein [Tropicimonas sp. IMCC6043]|uniref:DUF5681 domain-containing protein n=1 Tax=Tropicimonas sp. IMCC6043 TaxID=2510645 RepID=UPI00101D9629|nr:DUF5681 domain-containing protein [Tropicimonas sp. IMCC6043]RYH07049.1 hypothetical protein EU800_21760 [Tropicimonas sp. IMCC6043]
MSDPGKDYEVGYGRPPKHTQFKKGQSGNPKGRPKGSKNVDTMLRETLLRPVVITENGKRRKITALEAFFRQTLKSALEGDARASDKLLKLLPMLQNALEREAIETEAAAAEAARDDRPVLAALAAMMGGAVDDLFLANQLEASDD